MHVGFWKYDVSWDVFFQDVKYGSDLAYGPGVVSESEN